MPSEADACASQDICSMKKKRKKSKLYYSSTKTLEELRMRMANNKFKLTGPNKFLDFGDADVADVAGKTNRDL